MKLRYLIALIFIALMLATAQIIGNSEYIFPEMAALSVGYWIIDKPVWRVTRLRLFLLLVAMAVEGTLIGLYSPLPLVANIAIAFIGAFTLLTLTRTTAFPIISAAILPLVLEQAAWSYPLIVAGLSAVLILGQILMERSGIRTPRRWMPDATPRNEKIRRGVILLAGVAVCALAAQESGWRYLILPPLIVAFTEFSMPQSGVRKAPRLILLLISAATILGAGANLTAARWGISPIVTFTLAEALLFLLFERTGRRFAPAAAICLVAALIPNTKAWIFIPQTIIGASIFIFAAIRLFPATSQVAVVPQNTHINSLK